MSHVPARPPMTDEEVDRLRATVPDDPIRLPPDCAACEACGVAVADRRVVATVAPATLTANTRTTPPVEFTRCPECQRTHDAADEYVSAHPALATRLGPDIARERVESVLFGLTLLGREAPETDLGLLLPRLQPAAHALRFSNPLTLTRGMCSPRPWAHVTTGQRAELRRAYANALRDRISLAAPPIALRCPTRGCVFCGLGSVTRSAIEVARRGSVQAAGEAVWREVNTNPKALGSNGPEAIWAHACPDCTRAIEEAGAIGYRARAQALVSFVGVTSRTKAQRLREAVEADFPPRLPAWRAVPNLRPSTVPWEHLRRVTDRLLVRQATEIPAPSHP